MSGISVDVNLDLSELDKFAKQVNETIYAEVGVLGDKTKKEDDEESIVDYAVAHEYGVVEHNLPRRSFIKDPLEKHLGAEIKTALETIGKYIERGRVDKAVDVLGKKGEEVIKKAFETQNDNSWSPLSPVTIAAMKESRRKGWKILQDSGDLLGSITHNVVRE